MKVTIKNYNFFVHPYSPQGLMLKVSEENCFILYILFFFSLSEFSDSSVLLIKK